MSTQKSMPLMPWVAEELRTQLAQTVSTLEQLIDESDSPSDSLAEVSSSLDVAEKILKVVGSPVPHMLAEELSALAKYIDADSVDSERSELLGRGVLHLIETLESQTETTLDHMALLNEIRASQVRSLFSETALFLPNLEEGLAEFSPQVGDGTDGLTAETLAQIADIHRQAVDTLIRLGSSDEIVFELRKVYSLLADKGTTSEQIAMGLAGLTLLTGLETGAIEVSAGLGSQVERLSEHLARLAADTDATDPGLLKNLLFYAVTASYESREKSRLVEAFNLQDIAGSRKSGSSNFQLDVDARKQVVASMRGELASVRENCEQFSFSGDVSRGLPQDLLEQIQSTFNRIRDTLVLLGSADAQTQVDDLLKAVNQFEDLKDSDRESAFVELAGNVIKLDDRLSGMADATYDANAPSQNHGQLDEARDSLVSEVREALARINAALDQHFRSAETPAKELVEQLAATGQILAYYPLPRLATVLTAIARFLGKAAAVPPEDQWIEITDALVATDYYLENLQAEVAVDLEQVQQHALEAARKLEPEFVDLRIAELEDSPTAASFEEVDSTTDADDPSASGEDVDSVANETAHEDPESAGESVPELDEFVEIFIEEAREVLDTLTEAIGRWKSGDEEGLVELRRGFHTLKGGGRMVGASAMGEFSWAVENLLNKVIEKVRPADKQVIEITENAVNQVSRMIEKLEKADLGEPDEVRSIREACDALAAGESIKMEQQSDSTVPVDEVQESPDEDQGDESNDVPEWTLDDEDLAVELDRIDHSGIAATGKDDLAEESSRPEEEHSEPDSVDAQPSESDAVPALDEQDRERRIRPLLDLMESGLSTLITEAKMAEQFYEAIDRERLKGLQADLQSLATTSDKCDQSSIAEISRAMAGLVSHMLDRENYADKAALDLAYSGHEELLRMLDAVASWQVVPEPSKSLIEEIAACEIERPAHLSESEEGEGSDQVVSGLKGEKEAQGESGTETADIEIGLNQDISSPSEDDRVDADELLQTFIHEAEDLTGEIRDSLEAWKQKPDNLSFADTLHRALHTLKGGARVSELSELGETSHEFESLILDQQAQKRADEPFFAEAYRRYDQLIDHIELAKSELSGSDSSQEATAAEDSKSAETLVTIHRTDVEETFTVAPTFQRGAEVELDRAKATRTQGTEVRVRADLLDDLVNLAGESIVIRGRIESQVNELDFNLEEFEAVIGRVQSLIRRLDAETEAQIEFRREQIAESEDEHEFDPLEMDRYSQLQQLSRQLQESVSDLDDVRLSMGRGSREVGSLLLHGARVNSELNDGLVRTRMVRFDRVVPRLERIARQIGDELNKNIRLEVLNVEGELDRQILDEVISPLEHMIRNAIDHGIESAQERKAAGKSEQGTVYLSVGREGGYMVVRLADDGRGLDIEAIRKQSVKSKLVTAKDAKNLSDRKVMQFVLEPGFSTAKTLTQISGRGVGMDVVQNVARQLGGRVDIDSRAGEGTVIRLSLPFTLSVNRALIVRCAEEIYSVPLVALEALVRLPKNDLADFYSNPDRTFEYAGEQFDFAYLGEMLEAHERPNLEFVTQPSLPMILFRSENRLMAVLVDEIVGTQELVVKSLGNYFKDVRGLSGAAIMGDGRVVVTLDMNGLIDVYSKLKLDNSETRPAVAKIEKPVRETPMIMVVDDSVTVRKFTHRFLTRAGYEVETARDGMDALRMVHDNIPDLMLLDLEMPRMDGFELLSILRSTKQFANIPVIVITSRTGEKHRERGLSLGAQKYFGKPYREDDLLEAIQEVLQSGVTADGKEGSN